MNWRKLFRYTHYVASIPPFYFVVITCASATIGILYRQNLFTFPFQYFPFYAGLLYFVGRIAFIRAESLAVSKNEMYGYAFVGSTGLALVIQSAMGMDFVDQSNQSSWDYTFAMWAFGIAFLFAGAACNQNRQGKSLLISLFLLALVVIPLFKATEGKLLLDYTQMRTNLGMDDFTHLAIAEWVVFLLIGSYAFANEKFRPLIVLISLFCLFSLQGRSSTFFTIIAFFVYGFIHEGRKHLVAVLVMTAIAALAYFFLPIEELIFDADQGSIERMTLSGEDADVSLQGRFEIIDVSINHLPQAALVGDPTFLAREAQSMGSYIHNLLSLWQFFGVVPFLIMIVVLIKSLRKMFTLAGSGRVSVMDEFASVLLIYSVISVIFSKSIVFYWIWFVVGYWMLDYSAGKRKRKRKRGRSGRQKTPVAATTS